MKVISTLPVLFCGNPGLGVEVKPLPRKRNPVRRFLKKLISFL